MMIAALFGAGSGALHAVTGPDHVLSLGPLVLQPRRAPWRIGATWGAGHAVGTLLLSLPVLWFADALHLPALASLGDRLAALALLATAVWSYFQARRGLAGSAAPAGRTAMGVGFVHGLTGAASLLLVLPMVASGSLLTSAVFLFAFAVGSTLGMAALTALLARMGARLEPRVAQRSRQLLCEELEPLSAQAYEEASKEYPEITSGPDYQMVQRVAQRITRAADEQFAWQAKLLKADDVPNAFCLPNGRIAVYTGILKLTQNEDGLAAVMGHEVAHAVLRHGGKRMTQGMLTQGAMTALDAGLGMAEMEEGTKGLVMGVLGAGAQYGVLLPYSRDHESEADIEGIRYAIRAGYDPNEAPKLWERMAALGSSGPEWMSTHPASEARAAKLREVIPQIVEQEKGWQPKSTKSVAPGALPK